MPTCSKPCLQTHAGNWGLDNSWPPLKILFLISSTEITRKILTLTHRTNSSCSCSVDFYSVVSLGRAMHKSLFSLGNPFWSIHLLPPTSRIHTHTLLRLICSSPVPTHSFFISLKSRFSFLSFYKVNMQWSELTLHMKQFLAEKKHLLTCFSTL